MSKITAIAHSNLAFVKYWGKRSPELNLPLNGSISMNLSSATTTTSVEFHDALSTDIVTVDEHEAAPDFARRVTKHMDRIRALAGQSAYAYIHTSNSFPAGTGFASSASGMAALTLAAVHAIGLSMEERALTVLARLGSGSACRSIPGGFVEWLAGDTTDKSYAVQIAPPEHWDILDIAVVVTEETKMISSSLGHQLALQSPFWQSRYLMMPERLDRVRTALLNRDFPLFGREIETEAISMHAVAMTSPHTYDQGWHSGIYYWSPDTMALINAVQRWRTNGLPVFFTLDAGPTVHLICPADQQEAVIGAVRELEQQQGNQQWSIVVSRPAPGAHLL